MEKKWYVVHTYSGFEEKVRLSIEEKVEAQGFQERITKILIPTERIVELRAGKKR
jgi:transcriptional antiterminator NusG